MAKPETIHGQHRNAALAERHRARLERELGMSVTITERRNAHGAYSSRGQFFTFEAAPEFSELDEFERYMEDYEGQIEEFEIESGGDTGDEVR